MKQSLFILLVLSLFLTACQNDDPVVPPQDLPGSVTGIYVVNEGGFGKSTSSLTFFVPDSGRLYQDIFFAANNRPLGDVANDMAIYENKGYIVVNNSDKIEVISTETNMSLHTISVPGNNPYAIAIYNAQKAYITNFAKGSVTVVNPTTYHVGKEIPVGKNPKGITIYGTKVYVCNSGDFSADSTVSVIDTETDSVVQTIVVAPGPNDIDVDGDGELYVRCYGYSDWSNPLNDKPGAISVINPADGIVAQTIDVPLATFGHPGKMSLSKKGFGYFVTSSNVMKFDTKNNVVLPVFIGRANAYSVAVDDITDNVYVTDPKDYVQRGIVYVYSQGAQIDSIEAGIIPGRIVFKK